MRNVPPDSNQAPPFEGRNLYLTDPALQRAVACEGGGWAQERLTAWGETLGRAETFALAARANRLPPQLNTHDRFGNRIDEVAYDPSWHELMSLATREGEHCAPWVDPRGRAQVARAAAYLLHAEVENGTQCPLTMTYAAVPVLKRYAASMPAITETWLPRMLSNDYDPRTLPLADKRAALVGMGMTERQGGSDVRANATAAERCGDGSYRLAGHKWFFSAPMCDGHLVLAQAQGGLSCFLLPRLLPDGTKNAVHIQRLKDKLGNRSNASSEVEFDGATAWLLGEEGRGVAVIIEMVQHTRLDCAIGSAGLIRGAVSQALHHAAHRRAFGRKLFEQPLMQNVLADLVLEAEASTALALRLARGFEANASPADGALARVATPALKYWICKRATMTVAEAAEVLGGNGYIEESPLPRMLREAPLNSIWEGSGNVICLDVLRAARREPAAIEALDAELASARGADARFDRHVAALVELLHRADFDESDARHIAGKIATAFAASLLLRNAPRPIAEAYCRSRLEEASGPAFGTLPRGIDCAAVLAALA